MRPSSAGAHTHRAQQIAAAIILIHGILSFGKAGRGKARGNGDRAVIGFELGVLDTNWNQNLVDQPRVFTLQFMYIVSHWVDPIKSASLPNWDHIFNCRMKAMSTDRKLSNMQDV